MKKKCTNCRQDFIHSSEDQELLKKLSYKELQMPDPEMCFNCRQQNIYAYRNERSLYRRKCDKCKKSVVSMFSAEAPYTVYCYECWWSDEFDPLNSGRDFDFEKPFFQQFEDMLKTTPLPHMIIGNAENSDYTNYSWQNKNSYLLTSSDYCEDCYYSAYLIKSRSCFDCLFVHDSELLYQCVDCKKCYSCTHLQNCHDCSDCDYCLDCRGCRDCFGCVGLRQKQYCIFNKQFSREEYEQKREEFLNDIEERFAEFRNMVPRKYANIENCENCSGDHLMSCKNMKSCFDMVESEDCSYCALGIKARDCMDCVGATGGTELSYMTAAAPENYQLHFSMGIWPKSSYLAYCLFSRSSKNCFGCCSLRNNEYCILNKQYSKEEYESLIPKIVEHMIKSGEWGKFFPIKMSPFAYNETLANEYYPFSKDMILQNGWRWQDEIEPVKGDDALICEVTGKPFKIIAQEKKFYEKMDLDEPTRCPDQRHKDRLALRTPRKLFERTCDNCGTAILTAYEPGRPEKVFCEKCYLANVY